MPSAEWFLELEMLLDDLSYEISNARAAGLEDPDKLRDIVKRMRDKVADAESLASAAGATRRAEEADRGTL